MGSNTQDVPAFICCDRVDVLSISKCLTVECSELVVKWSKMWKVESQVQNASQCEESLSGEPGAQIVNLILSS